MCEYINHSYKLCSLNDCKSCFEKSFASFEKVKYWNYTLNKVRPRDAFKTSSIKYWFKCNVCNHDFDIALDKVVNDNNWCPYCSSHRNCKKCTNCINKTFASCNESKYWNYNKNIKRPIDISKNSKEKAWFDCPDCNHSFKSTVSSVSKGHWCAYCAKLKLCDDDRCQDCFNKSFASIEKSNEWDYKLNKVKPRDVFKSSAKKYWFKCKTCCNNYHMMLSALTYGGTCYYCNGSQLEGNTNEEITKKYSFANNKYSKYWNYEKNNGKKPEFVFASSNKKYWFSCDKCNHDFQTSLNDITNRNYWCPYCNSHKKCGLDNCNFCFNKSFASHKLSKYWNYELNNNIRPIDIALNANKSYYFTCDKCYHDSYIFIHSIVVSKTWCRYCDNTDICNDETCDYCYNKSFKSDNHVKYWNYKLNKDNPRYINIKSNNKYWFDCTCGHTFDISLYNVSIGKWCPYCCIPTTKICNDNECKHCNQRSFKSSDKAIFWDYAKNGDIKPENVIKGTENKYWFICENNHSFEAGLNNVSRGKWCPFCVNKTEYKVYQFLNGTFKNVICHYTTNWCINTATMRKLPYDFCIEELKIIIELDGDQHFKQISNWKSPEETQKIDFYKMQKAVENKYSIIRLLQEDVYENKIDWKAELLKYIKKYDNPICTFISSINNKYENYINFINNIDTST
jgi:hypothetical protein